MKDDLPHVCAQQPKGPLCKCHQIVQLPHHISATLLVAEYQNLMSLGVLQIEAPCSKALEEMCAVVLDGHCLMKKI